MCKWFDYNTPNGDDCYEYVGECSNYNKWEPVQKRCVFCRWYPDIVKSERRIEPNLRHIKCVYSGDYSDVYGTFSLENRNGVNMNWAQKCPGFEWEEELTTSSIKPIQ